IGRLRLKLLVFFVIGHLSFLIVEPVKPRLKRFPRPPGNVVVPEGPEGEDHQDDAAQHKNTAVGFFLFALVYAPNRHPCLSSYFVLQRSAQRKDPDTDQRQYDLLDRKSTRLNSSHVAI